MVVRAIRDRIDARTLTPGARLPSIRAMAEMSGVARSTVVEAYDRLAAEG
ncbi:winged helix-turn-helix domain-containing protein [Sphingomonas sp. I4]